MVQLFRGKRCAVVAAALALAALSGAGVHAQQYRAIPIKNGAQSNALRPKAASILRAPGAPSPADKKTLDDFFTYFYASMTNPAPDQLALLAKSRKDLFQQFLNLPNGSAEARDHVVALTLKAMKAIAKGNYHPAARYNAVLILGQLDTAAARPGGPAVTPLPAATAALVELLTAAQADAAAVSPPVVVGALIGLERHTRLGVDAAQAEPIGKAAIAVATSVEPPEGVAASVHSWTRVLAARVVANVFAAKLTPEAHAALVKTVGDKSMVLDDRCLVAESLRPTMYKDNAAVKIDEMVAAVGKLAQDVMADESKKANAYQEKTLADPGALMGPGGGFGGGLGRGGFGMEGGGGGGFGANALAQLGADAPQYQKRRMLDRVMALIDAGRALADAGSAELKTRLDALTQPMQAVADEAVKPKATDAGVVGAVLELADTVNQVVGAWNGGAPAAAAADGDAEGFGPPAA